MSSQQKMSKKGSLTPGFLAAAVKDPEGALAHMFLAAFGITLAAVMAITDKITRAKDVKMVIMAFAAGVQIRAHVVFVGKEYAMVKTLYPELIIEGKRGVKDAFNFGALHALGHMLGHMSSGKHGAAMLAKAGSCITGEGVTENEAGNINKEIAASWSGPDKAAYSAWKEERKPVIMPFVDLAASAIDTRAQAFAKALVVALPVGAAPSALVEEAEDDDDVE